MSNAIPCNLTHQILISQIHGRTLCIPISEATSLSLLKESIHRIGGVHPEDQRLLLNGNDLIDDKYQEAINQKADFLSIKFALRGGCTGGKGGFGSLLRSAKSVKKTTNYGSCRDLHGRRLRDVQNERRLTEWTEKEKIKTKQDGFVVKEKEKDMEEEQERGGKEEGKQKSWELKTKEVTMGVGNSVEKGLALMKEKELKRKREENTNSKVLFFGLEDEEEDISESDSETLSVEPEKKKHCPEILFETPKYSSTETITENTITTIPTSLGPPVGSKRSAENLEY